MSNPYRALPSVDRILQHPAVAPLRGRYANGRLTEQARAVLERARAGLANSSRSPADLAELAQAVIAGIAAVDRPPLRPVINATGVVLHTNLGRAPLSDATRAAMDAAGRSFSNLEYDLAAGRRGSRFDHLSPLIQAVTGAEAGLAVNNNASALLLSLAALATGREVVVSRGQAVEIGGGFRIPDIVRQSGASLVEVGTTNRTRIDDYRGTQGAALLRIHASNFKIIGFTEQPSLSEMRTVADEEGALLLDDLGSGCLLDTRRYGLSPEPTVQDSLADGADLAFFSGDKLLGGPQAGLIVGRAELVAKIGSHPLARAVRPDKTTIAGLAATLRHYLLGEAETQIPVWRMIAVPLDALDQRATVWRDAIGSGTVIEGRSMIGGGSLPGESLPTRALALTPSDGANRLADRLRASEPAVVARVEHDSLRLDPRTVDPSEDEAVIGALQRALSL
ncbi:MAG: L-seryl-tRNA(Sec) selenium transferase [Chloroflexi bacterium]|nr:L-seryl-tRNA(Sec) selenium transferase [Chloroflexota bacterium]